MRLDQRQREKCARDNGSFSTFKEKKPGEPQQHEWRSLREPQAKQHRIERKGKQAAVEAGIGYFREPQLAKINIHEHPRCEADRCRQYSHPYQPCQHIRSCKSQGSKQRQSHRRTEQHQWNRLLEAERPFHMRHFRKGIRILVLDEQMRGSPVFNKIMEWSGKRE